MWECGFLRWREEGEGVEPAGSDEEDVAWVKSGVLGSGDGEEFGEWDRVCRC